MQVEEPLSYDYLRLCKELKVDAPKMGLLKGTLAEQGYKMVRTYYNANLFKTDAPPSLVYDIMRKYKRDVLKQDVEGEIPDIPLIEVPFERKQKYFTVPFEKWGPRGKGKKIQQ